MVIVAVTWGPLLVLSLVAGNFYGGHVKVTFLEDIEAHSRFLIVTPLLVFSEIAVGLGLSVQARHMLEMGIVQDFDKPRYRKAQLNAMWLRESIGMELFLGLLALVGSIFFRSVLRFTEGASSWEHTNGHMTLAGWWHMCVSLPCLYFLLFRWIFVILCWNWFLFLVSRLQLKLTPTHPDRVGGLGFLGWGVASFAPVLTGASLFFSAAVATEIIQKEESLDSLKYHCLIFLVVAIILIYAPLLCFAKVLSSCRLKGLLEFGELVWKHDIEFEEKWMKRDGESPSESLLGCADLGTMANVGTCYEHINEMWLIPFDMKAFAVLVLAVAAPLVPLLATTEQMREILLKIGELLV